MTEFEFDPRKFAELLLFFAKSSEDDRFFGSTKLNKMLFVADFFAYGYFGCPITGATYIHLPYGPAPRELLPIRERLQEEGRLDLREQELFIGTQKRPVALDDPDTSVFSEKELALACSVLGEFENIPAGSARDWSHTVMGWMLTEDREEIPYHTVFMFQQEPVTMADLRWAQETAQQLSSS